MIENIIDINANKPHMVAELMCLKCLYRYWGVFMPETYLKQMECSKCSKIGYIINTGQDTNVNIK